MTIMNICFNKPDLAFPASRKLAELLCECESRMTKCCASIPACTLFATSRKLIERFIATSKDACRTFVVRTSCLHFVFTTSRKLIERFITTSKDAHRTFVVRTSCLHFVFTTSRMLVERFIATSRMLVERLSLQARCSQNKNSSPKKTNTHKRW